MNEGWTLNDGVDYCRKVELLLIPIGYHCAIGGSVLMNGESQKDLDVFIYPHKTKDTASHGVIIHNLPASGFTLRAHEDYGDGKTVYSSLTDCGRRVDFFFVQ